ncbi:hypothetical protein HALO59_100259 [Halomonas sp. 59]|nr:hypothetical protein HALO59_100259 [Halomonas sp. 59]CAD5248668.1 hypothetical protein HALO113_100281 [Halomonas sp. 113]VXC01156.1 hypothetical protein HALO153_230154 [Halomonas titanicae]
MFTLKHLTTFIGSIFITKHLRVIPNDNAVLKRYISDC